MRASTPAVAHADPPESTVVIHRHFSEITSTWGRSVGPGVQELLLGAGILGGYSAPPDATVSIPGTGFTSGQVSQRLLVPIIVFR